MTRNELLAGSMALGCFGFILGMVMQMHIPAIFVLKAAMLFLLVALTRRSEE